MVPPRIARAQMSKHNNKKVYLLDSDIFIATVSFNFRVSELRGKQALPSFSEKSGCINTAKLEKTMSHSLGYNQGAPS